MPYEEFPRRASQQKQPYGHISRRGRNPKKRVVEEYDPQYDEMPVSIDMLTPFPESGDDSVGTKHSKTEKVVKK